MAIGRRETLANFHPNESLALWLRLLPRDIILESLHMVRRLLLGFMGQSVCK